LPDVDFTPEEPEYLFNLVASASRNKTWRTELFRMLRQNFSSQTSYVLETQENRKNFTQAAESSGFLSARQYRDVIAQSMFTLAPDGQSRSFFAYRMLIRVSFNDLVTFSLDLVVVWIVMNRSHVKDHG
jgi:hypothetical protein